jgi:hypothetical protein
MNPENTDETAPPPIKRSFLEISELDKFKNVMINKPFETKRLKASDALDKVKLFLPSLKESTDKLLAEHKDNPSGVDIENCENDENVIEMNIQFVKENDSDEDSDDHDYDDDNISDSDNEDVSDSDLDGKDKKLLDINDLINQEQIKINSQIVFNNKNKSKKLKKPFIKIINNVEEEEEDEDSTSDSNIDSNQPCTSKDSQ